jgi:hypothetical protein
VAKPDVPLYVVSVAWNSQTLNAAGGGLQGFRITSGGQEVEHWAGDDLTPRFVVAVRSGCEIVITMDYVSLASSSWTPNQKSDMVIVVKMADLTTTKTITISDMKLISISSSNQQATPGSMDARFKHESDDGSANPVASVT